MKNNEINMDEIIGRINELYKKAKEEGLTETEKNEQQDLRRIYIDSFKSNLKGHLEGIKPNNPVDKNKN